MGFSKIFQTGSSLPQYSYSVDLKSPIGIKWTSLGGLETTGRAVSNAMPLDDGIGLMQMFMLGAIFWSPAFGAVYMSERVWQKWSSPSVEKSNTVQGEAIQGYLGYPTEDTMRRDMPNGLRDWLYFERGMIYVGPEGSSVVFGDIYGHYRVLNGLDGVMGAPISDERSAPNGGRVSHFAQGDIFEHGSTGPHEVHGAIRDRYLEMNGPAGALGYPTSDEESIHGKQGEIGRFNRFENGSGIYFSPATGAWDVYGAIWAKWQDNGGVTGKLGFPTSGETDTPSSGGRYNEFQHGVIVWHDGGPYDRAHVVTDLQLVISEYKVDDDFNVQVYITATPGQVNHGRMPAGGEFDGGVKSFDPALIMVSVDLVRANSAITVWLLAISENLVGKDDRMGTITANYTVDNVWGLLDTNFTLHNDSFDATLRVLPKTSEITTNPHELFWPFENTPTFKLGWNIYARTFRDVKETDKDINLNPFDLSVHPWEIFLYEAFYNSLAQGGSCFGQCLEAVYAREHRSLFVEPVKSNPFNPYQRNHVLGQGSTRLKPELAGDGITLDEVNVKHGYQMGAGMIEFLLSKWMAGALHDPERAYRESYADFHSGNWPILTISDQDKFSQDHGHALVPYEWDPTPDKIVTALPGQPLIIYVKNPNFPLADRNDKHCQIEINHLTWKWKFQFSDKEVWTGSGVTGGRLLAIPFEELNARPVTPGYTVMGLLAAGVFIVLAGDGETEQITDGYGRTFFHYTEGTQQAYSSPTSPSKEINWDRTSRIPNLMAVPMFGAVRGTGTTTAGGTEGLARLEATPELYYHRPGPPPGVAAGQSHQETTVFVGVGSQRRTGAVGEALAAAREDALHFQVRGNGRGKLRWTVAAPRMTATVVADMEVGVVDSIHLGGTGGHFQNVTVQFPNATKARDVSVMVTGWRGEDRQQSRSFVLENLSLTNGDSIRAQITNGGRELIIENRGRAKTFNLRLSSGLEAKPVTVRPNVPLDAASVVRLTPSNWTPAAPAAAPIRLEVLDKSGLKVLRSTNL
jgi:hypothetical protein